MIGHLILRLTLWFLLTANFSLANIVIGVAIALLLPRNVTMRESWQDWLQAIVKTLKAIPIAYLEAFQMILKPHNYEDVMMERVSPQRSRGLVFMDIFLITFTPKTIVQKYHEEGWYEVHWVRRRKQG